MTHPHPRALEAAARALSELHIEASLEKGSGWRVAAHRGARAAVTAYLAALQETHALVPREATGSMTDAAEDAACDHFAIDGDKGPWLRQDGYKAAWRAMIDAAPPAAQEPRP